MAFPDQHGRQPMPARRRRRTLTMIEDRTMPPPLGAWKPATRADARQLLALQCPREGDLVGHPERDQVAHLVRLARRRGVPVLFRPAACLSPPPATSPAKRRKNRPKPIGRNGKVHAAASSGPAGPRT